MFFKKKKTNKEEIVNTQTEELDMEQEQELFNIVQEKFAESEDINEIIIYPALLPTNMTCVIQKDNIDIRITKRAEIKEYKYGDLINYTIMIVNCSKEMNYENIGVNEPCPCGSGKKFKKCCKLKPQEEYKIFLETLSEYEVFKNVDGKTYSEVCIADMPIGDTINLNYEVRI